MHRLKFLSMLVLLATLLMLPIGIALAIGNSTAFGYKGVYQVKGVRVYVWTGTPPGGEVWTASPVGVCENASCSGKVVETGWIKGTAWDLGDVLQQYVAYLDPVLGWRMEFHKGDLSENSWYQFMVNYSDNRGRWEVRRDNDLVWERGGLGWVRGSKVAAGSEAGAVNGWMTVWGWHPEYGTGGGIWTLYNYNESQASAGAHIEPAYDFGYHAWGGF